MAQAQFYSPKSLKGVRRNFNAWIAGLGADAGLTFAVDPASAENTLANFFDAFTVKAAKLRATHPTTLAPAAQTEDSSNSPLTVTDPQAPVEPGPTTTPAAFTAANVTPQVSRSSPYQSYSLAPEGDPYSTALVPGESIAEKEQQKQTTTATKIVVGLTATALLLSL